MRTLELGPNTIGLSTSNEINIPIHMDSKLETIEVFLVLLNVIAAENVSVSRNCAVGRIVGVIDATQDGNAWNIMEPLHE